MGKKNRVLKKFKLTLPPEGTSRRIAICDEVILRCLAQHGYAPETIKFGKGDLRERLAKLECCLSVRRKLGDLCLKVAVTYAYQSSANTIKELKDILSDRFVGWSEDIDTEISKLKELVNEGTEERELLAGLITRKDQDTSELTKMKESRGVA